MPLEYTPPPQPPADDMEFVDLKNEELVINDFGKDSLDNLQEQDRKVLVKHAQMLRSKGSSNEIAEGETGEAKAYWDFIRLVNTNRDEALKIAYDANEEYPGLIGSK